MKLEIQLLIDRQRAGETLETKEIRSMMFYALDLLKEFDRHTQASIAKAHRLLEERSKIAA